MSTIISSVPFKFGRKPRTRNPRVPHMSAMLAGSPAVLLPDTFDQYSKNLPSNLGMMLNDLLGDCSCCGVLHSRQVWTLNASGVMITEPDCDVEKLYEGACGYDPAKGGEGPGGNLQSVLTYLLNTGYPTGPTGQVLEKIAAFVEVDPRNPDDVKRVIQECGVAYIGFDVPDFLMDNGLPASTWDVNPSWDGGIDGGHCVVLCGWDTVGFTVISWGQTYKMTYAFFLKYVDEVYGIADYSWITAKQVTPFGMSLSDLESQMEALKEA